MHPLFFIVLIFAYSNFPCFLWSSWIKIFLTPRCFKWFKCNSSSFHDLLWNSALSWVISPHHLSFAFNISANRYFTFFCFLQNNIFIQNVFAINTEYIEFSWHNPITVSPALFWTRPFFCYFKCYFPFDFSIQLPTVCVSFLLLCWQDIPSKHQYNSILDYFKHRLESL